WVAIDDGTTVVPPADGLQESSGDYFYDVQAAAGWEQPSPAIGRHVRIVGLLRWGQVFADRCVVTGASAASAAKKAGARARWRPGRMTMYGILTKGSSQEIAVNGFAALGGGAATPSVGTRVRVDARLARSGVRVTRIRAR